LIEFRCSRIDKKNHNTPIIKDSEIDALAEMLLADYKPQLLKEPGKIKYEHFLESYLGANLDYRHIYYEEDEELTLGVTAFNQEKLPIFDRENMCVDEITLEKNSIVLDFYVTAEGREGLELFTGLHEGGHFWMHQGVYARNEMQISLFGIDELRPVTCCRKADIESFGKRRGHRTPEQWREHQADYFASALAMPGATFIPLVQEILRSWGVNDGYVVEDAGIDEHYLAEDVLPRILSNTYGVSRTAAYVKLRKCGFVVDRDTINRENQQLRIL
jgi:Zn-dependent peptidase ImmA (M78 family)